jgi:hypothetical protein
MFNFPLNLSAFPMDFLVRTILFQVPFSEIVSWGAIYECPAASCALLAQLTLSSTSPQQHLGAVKEMHGTCSKTMGKSMGKPDNHRKMVVM